MRLENRQLSDSQLIERIQFLKIRLYFKDFVLGFLDNPGLFLWKREFYSLYTTRKHKKKSHQLQDFIATETLSLQKRLTNLTPKQLEKKLFEDAITGREGFFLLNSSKNLTPDEALTQYKSRDTIEKLIDSLKNVIKVKPVRVWDDDEIKGILLIGFLAQVMISLVKYEHEELKTLHPKTIIESIRNLTLTIEHKETFVQNRIISNFDKINRSILGQNAVIT